MLGSTNVSNWSIGSETPEGVISEIVKNGHYRFWLISLLMTAREKLSDTKVIILGSTIFLVKRSDSLRSYCP